MAIYKKTTKTNIADAFSAATNSKNAGFKNPFLTLDEIQASQKSGTFLTFSEESIYGTTSTPGTTNVSSDITDAVLGNSNLIIHKSSVIPTFDSKFKILSTSGTYVPNVLNYIFCTYINSTTIIYSIAQA